MKSNIKSELQDGTEGEIIHVNELLEYLKRLTDGRKPRGIRYQLETILVFYILAKFCGQDKVYGIADWIQQRKEYLIEGLGLKYPGMPHHSTYRRILGEQIDGDELEQVMADYLSQQTQPGQEVVIVIDGKTVRGTIHPKDPFGLHQLAAYIPDEGIVLMQMVVEKDKENEIVVAPKLLKCLDLRDKVVTGDAMHTQRQLSIQIVASGGHFVWIVKDNQATTRQAIEQLFSPEVKIPGVGNPPTDFRVASTTEKQSGRLETRTLTASSMLNEYLDWPHIQQVFKLESKLINLSTGEVKEEIRYGITSLPAQIASPNRLLKIVRSEWGIENGLHYRRDVTFQEDKTRMTNKDLARNVTIINNLVISLLNYQGFSNHARARRVFDACPDKALAIIFGL